MADFNSDQYANSVATPATMNTPRDSGKERILYAKYTTPASSGPAAGDNLVVGRLPAGARVLSAEVCVPASFVTSSAKLGYGNISKSAGTATAVDDDRWGTGIDLSTAGRKQFLTVAADMDATVPVITTAGKLENEVAVMLNFTTGNPAASKQIAVLIKYVID